MPCQHTLDDLVCLSRAVSSLRMSSARPQEPQQSSQQRFKHNLVRRTESRGRYCILRYRGCLAPRHMRFTPRDGALTTGADKKGRP